ncbi:hypothetical protein ACFU6S_32685 [Streptomyces sp. NPDC057456]|uniref:hypothetical protein n=1 Tax=Streptomyces sp. NPDC057456 TaxID=3346139 RepID=UPI0036A86CD1
MRATDGALLGAILPLGHMANRHHAEWYHPSGGGDFYSCGNTEAVITQGVARILEERRGWVGEVPLGRDLVLDLDLEPIVDRPARLCPWGWCVDPECVDHAPVV